MWNKKGFNKNNRKTNLSYIEPHRIIIKDIIFLAFNYETNIYIENLSNKILIKDLEEYLKGFKKIINSILNNDFKLNIWHFIKKW